MGIPPWCGRAAAEQLEATWRERCSDPKGLYLARKKVETTLAPGVVVRISLFCYAVSNRCSLAGMCVCACRSLPCPLAGETQVYAPGAGAHTGVGCVPRFFSSA